MSLYQLLIIELLLQRTRAETVNRFHAGFFLHYPDWNSLARANRMDLEAALKPFGLYRRRAKVFQILASAVVGTGGELPRSVEDLGALPGLGPYMVNAVLMYRDGAPVPLLDGGVARVLERFFGPRELVDIRDDPYLHCLEERILELSKEPSEINWGIIDISALICMKNITHCHLCVLSKKCPNNRYGLS
ncbi:hypothetical protein KUV89_16950 [Marinobacter hydrocarbonoclasticus]|nr:hypothetical protein [Marinobacter nauticus]